MSLDLTKNSSAERPREDQADAIITENQDVTNRAAKSQREADRKSQRPRRDAGQERPRAEDQRKAIKKVEKLEDVAASLRRRERCSITRLTVVKGLCKDPGAAAAFALFLARKIQQRMRAKNAPKRYRELVNRPVREMKPFLEDPTEERIRQLWSLFHEIEAEQNEYEHIGWGVVRNVKSFDLLVVEQSLRAVLRSDEAPIWLYQAARDYAGHTNTLPPSSAPMVEEIARFWRKSLGIKR